MAEVRPPPLKAHSEARLEATDRVPRPNTERESVVEECARRPDLRGDAVAARLHVPAFVQI